MAINTDYLIIRELLEIETLPAHSLLGRDEGLTGPIPQDRFQPAAPRSRSLGSTERIAASTGGAPPLGPASFRLLELTQEVTQDSGLWAASRTWARCVRSSRVTCYPAWGNNTELCPAYPVSRTTKGTSRGAGNVRGWRRGSC